MENEENQNQVSLRFPPPLEIAPRFPQSHNPDDDSPLPKTKNQKARKEPQRLKKPQPPSSGSSFDEKMLVPTRELVVAKENLAMGSVITVEDVRLIDFPEQAYPKEAFGSIEDVIDRSVINVVLANEPILAGRVTEKGAGVGLAPLIPEGERAVAVPISEVTGVSGFINPGSEVDILLTGTPGEGGERVTTTILARISDLAPLTARVYTLTRRSATISPPDVKAQ